MAVPARSGAWLGRVAAWGGKEFRRTSNIVAVLSVAVSFYALHSSSKSEQLQAQRLELERIQRTQAELRELFRKKIEIHLETEAALASMSYANTTVQMRAGVWMTSMDRLLTTQAIALADSIPGHLTSADYNEISLGLSGATRYADAFDYSNKAVETAKTDHERINAKLQRATVWYLKGEPDQAGAAYEDLITAITDAQLSPATKQDYLIQVYISWCGHEWNAGNTAAAESHLKNAEAINESIVSPMTKAGYARHLKVLYETLNSPPAETLNTGPSFSPVGAQPSAKKRK